jgi:hypothetical protein
VIFSLLALIVLAVLFLGNGGKEESLINEDQIRMEKNGEIITVNKNGLVEYKTKDSVTYKIWDSGKVDRFFDLVRNKARNYLENPNQSGSCVWVTLYLDGELVTICFSEDDEVVREVYEEFEDDGNTTDISYLFDDEEDNDDDGEEEDELSDYFDITPTPTLTPTPAPGGGGDNGEPELPPPLPVKASCESWEEQIVGGRAIISNTLCSVSVEEE